MQHREKIYCLIVKIMTRLTSCCLSYIKNAHGETSPTTEQAKDKTKDNRGSADQLQVRCYVPL